MVKKFNLIVGVTGLARSGKDTVARMLAEALKIEEFTMSDLLAEDLKRRDLEPTKENMLELAKEWRYREGATAFSEKTLARLKGPNAIVSGVRTPADVINFKENTRKFALVSVAAPENVRFERKTVQDPFTFNEFFHRDREDAREQGMDLVLKMAEYKITNDGSLKDLEKQVAKAVKDLKLKSFIKPAKPKKSKK